MINDWEPWPQRLLLWRWCQASGSVHTDWGSDMRKALSCTLTFSAGHVCKVDTISLVEWGTQGWVRQRDWPEVTQLRRGRCGIHTLVWHEPRFWFHETGSKLFSMVSLIYLLALTLTLALWSRLRSTTALIATGDLSSPVKVYSTRASTSWHMALHANGSTVLGKTALTGSCCLSSCPADGEMTAKWPNWHQIHLLIFHAIWMSKQWNSWVLFPL